MIAVCVVHVCIVAHGVGHSRMVSSMQLLHPAKHWLNGQIGKYNTLPQLQYYFRYSRSRLKVTSEENPDIRNLNSSLSKWYSMHTVWHAVLYPQISALLPFPSNPQLDDKTVWQYNSVLFAVFYVLNLHAHGYKSTWISLCARNAVYLRFALNRQQLLGYWIIIFLQALMYKSFLF